MPPQIFTIAKVPEDKLIETIKIADDDTADIVTAVNDEQGTFTVEQTFMDHPVGTSGVIIKVGKMSTFGGPDDTGVGPGEGLSLFDASDVAANPDLFLAQQPPNTTGLARRLDPTAKYLACRWDLDATPRSFLKLNTTLVKVTNPTTNRSENARPADTGPAISTGRVADLSLGLAEALELETDATCRLEIPTPETGVAVGVDLKVIDSTIFPKEMNRELVVMTTSNGETYWVVNQIGPQEGGQSLLRHVDDKTEILLSDTTVFPVAVSDQVPADIAAELNKAAPALGPSPSGPVINPPQAGANTNALVFAAATAFLGHNTNVPGTDHGNLACAWAVNEVVRLALGKPISTDGGGNGLSTDGIFDVLKMHHTQLPITSQPDPGTIIISPTEGSQHGHVGIVGRNPGGAIDNTQILSNSSSAAKFQQNYTIGKWKAYFENKGLDVLLFGLNASEFGLVGAAAAKAGPVPGALLTLAMLQKHWPNAAPNLIQGMAGTADVLGKLNINTPLRIAHFMAQISQECGSGTEMVESLNYSAQRMMAVFPSRFPTIESTQPFVHNERAFGDKVYNGRMGNQAGTDDGFNFRGRGCLQLTGRDSYSEIGTDCGLGLINNPDLAIDPKNVLLIAATEFVRLGCLPDCDRDDVVQVSARINLGHTTTNPGSINGLSDRRAQLQIWKQEFGLA
jgi:putative chitinase